MSDIIQHLSDNSAFAQPDRSISGMNHQQIATAVQFAVNFIFANLAGGCDRHIQIDVAVHHALLVPVSPVVALNPVQNTMLSGGEVFTETMFSWSGLGRLDVGAI